MKRLVVAAGFLLGLVLLGGDASAQTGTARGKVLDDKGQGIADVKIDIEFTGGVNRKYETRTGKKGDYTQVGLYPGTYRITATKQGLQGQYVDVRIALGDPTVVPDMVLAPPKGAAPGSGGPSDSELRGAFKKALDLTQAGQFDQAEAAYKEILAKSPSIPEVHYNLGYVYSQKKDWAGAEASYQKALELKPDYSDATVALAKVYQDSGQGDKAAALMNKSAEGSTDPKVLFNAAIFHLNAGQSEEAVADFLKAEAADPTNAEIQYHLGTLAVGQNKIGEAITRLEKYLAMNPQSAQNIATAKGLLQALKPKK